MRRIVGVSICLVLIMAAGRPLLAAESHEDPAAAEPVYSGIALLDYYSACLDLILQKDVAGVEAGLEKIPFACVPSVLEPVTADFAAAGMVVAGSVAGIDRDVNAGQSLIGQSRFEEAGDLAVPILDNIGLAYEGLDRIRAAAAATGAELGADSPEAGVGLREAYDRVLDRIERIWAMLSLYETLLTGWLAGEEEPEASLTGITFEIAPSVAFVGEYVRFSGRLSAGGEGLPGRAVDILVDGAGYATVITDVTGYYEGEIFVPCRYAPELGVQALYYPREADIGGYRASLSPVVMLRVLYYEAGIELEVPETAYPGREALVSGCFDYGDSPPPDSREIEFLLDDEVIFGSTAGEVFTGEISLAADVGTGEHVLTLSAAASGRYAPVVKSVVLDVSRAAPVLMMELPGLVLVPGCLEAGGRLASEVGPVAGAGVTLELGGDETEVTTTADGALAMEMKLGMGPGVIGSQDLSLKAVPQEPWHDVLVVSRPLMVINWVNCGIILLALVALGLFLPGVLRRRLGIRLRVPASPLTAAPPPVAAGRGASAAPVVPGPSILTVTEPAETGGDARRRIFGWYRRLARLVLRLGGSLLRPQQTLREFAGEQGKVLGPAARYFLGLTGVVERLFYGRGEPDKEDVLRSRLMSENVYRRFRSEDS